MPLYDLALFLLGMAVIAIVYATAWCHGRRHLCREIGLTEEEYFQRRKDD